MPTPALRPEVQARRRAAIEDCLRDGYAPYGVTGGRGSSVQEAAKRLNMSNATLSNWVRRQMELKGRGSENACPDWSAWRIVGPVTAKAVGRGCRASETRVWLLTAAQDDTAVHGAFWRNLTAYARHRGAEVMVGGFTYQKGLFEDHASRSAVFAEEVRPFMRHEAVDLGPVVFCAEMNTLPTAVRPLAGLESYTAQKWGVFPHAKVQLVSVPTTIGGPVKMIMTTGACTVDNYVERKAGLKARFHHVIGATVVEIDPAGRMFCRQINATSDGAFQDLDTVVRDGKITTGQRVEAVTWGDIHREKLDPVVALASWGLDVDCDRTVSADTLLDVLKPRYQFFHDILDFDTRNHHRIKDQHHRFAMVCRGTDRVEDAVVAVARFLRETERDWCRSVVCYSNHDDALLKWLKTADYREDAVNAPFFLRCQTAVYEAIQRGEPGFNVFRWILGQIDGRDLEGIDFVDDDQSFMICQAAGGIECGMHGHLGINGARGSAAGLIKTAVKINRGHDHSASILDGVYTAGLSGLFDQGYNRGLSSWTHSHIVTYPNGKRTLVTLQDGRWRG